MLPKRPPSYTLVMDQVTKHMGFFQFLEIASVIQWGATHKKLIYLRVQKIHSDIQ